MRRAINWLREKEPNNFTRILIATLPAAFAAFISIYASTMISNQNINNLQNDLTQKNETNIYTEPSSKNEETKGDSTDIEGKNGNFNKDSWTFSYNTSLDKEGYYCPSGNSFPSWFMWSKNKYKANYKAQINFSLRDKTDNDKNPTLYFSYGDKTGNAPDSFYRINIFDGDLRTIRLYNRKEEDILFDRSAHDAPIDKYISFSISPTFPNPKSSILIINPVISYQLDSVQQDFTSKKEFKIELPIPTKDQQGDGFQYGIGVSKGDCFRIISSNI